MEVPKLTKTLPEVLKNTLPKIFIPNLHGWFKYDFGKPIKPTVKPMLVLTLEFILSDFKRENIAGVYGIRFEYTTEPIYNPLQICQLFHWATETGIEDFKSQFKKEGFIGYPVERIIAPTFEQAFPVLKELYYPPDHFGN